MVKPQTRRIKVDVLARVEGEGALDVTLAGDEVQDVHLRIFEPPRFFETMLIGRHYTEVPDIVARICGICPVAYQMSAVHALESLFEVDVGNEIRALRRLLYCGEWVESHALHVYMLHAPDFLGVDSALDLADSHGDILRRGLRLKKVGDTILQVLGGRAVHPVSVCVGGFSRVPGSSELRSMLDDLKWARDAALDTVRWVAGFDFPDLVQDYTFVALQSNSEYPMNEGEVAASDGLKVPASLFEEHYEEHQEPHSTALHSHLHGKPYLVGPQARLHLNHQRLYPIARQAMTDVGLNPSVTNPHQSIIVRSLEILQAIDEAIEIINGYEAPAAPAEHVLVKEGTGMAATEAPRGLLYHRYRVNAEGLIEEAKIVPPTAQSQARIEEDMRNLLPTLLDRDDDEIALECERVIRCYDPCISCSTHFLKLNIRRT